MSIKYRIYDKYIIIFNYLTIYILCILFMISLYMNYVFILMIMKHNIITMKYQVK